MGQMWIKGIRAAISACFILMFSAAMSSPADAVEDGLLEARIGASYREVMRKFHEPDGVLIAAGEAVSYQVMPKVALIKPGETALPPLNSPSPGAGPIGSSGVPAWVEPVRVSYLADQQAEWVYDLRKTRGVTLGIVLSGEGADAVVTDVIVAGYPEHLKGKESHVLTEKGVTLQSSYATVLEKYGFPPLVEIFTPGAAPAVNSGRNARRQPAGIGTGNRMGGPGGRRGGPGGQPGRIGRGAASSFSVELTQMSGGRGDMMGGPRGRPGMMGGPSRSNRGQSPSRGRNRNAAASKLMATALVNNRSVNFSRDCILSYEGIAFTLHDMRVIRIHVSE